MESSTLPGKSGPKRHSAEERARAVERFRSSGQSVGSYAGEAGISDWTLRRWVTEANGLRRPRPPARLVPVRMKPAGGGEAERIEVVLVEGTILRVPTTISADKLGALVVGSPHLLCNNSR